MKERIGLIGFGTVGSALYAQVSRLTSYDLAAVAVKHKAKHRELPAEILTDDAMAVVEDPAISIILEAIDHTEDAFGYAIESLKLGKTYISASKKMVAENIKILLQAEERYGGKLFYEAAVGGAIPILRTLREHLQAEEINAIEGILNGTCNYILSMMWKEEWSFKKALAEAQELGFAESDPTSDIDGFDAYYKAIILASTWAKGIPEFGRIMREGISEVSIHDVLAAKQKNEKIKLVASIEKNKEIYSIDIRPRIVVASDPLYWIDQEQNAVIISGARSGQLTLSGAGAGGHATASAMVADLVNAPTKNLERVRNLLKSIH